MASVVRPTQDILPEFLAHVLGPFGDEADRRLLVKLKRIDIESRILRAAALLESGLKRSSLKAPQLRASIVRSTPRRDWL